MIRNDFIILSGASGVGKTTAFDELIRRRQKGLLDFYVPLKITTRPRRASDNPEEIKSISEKQYKLFKGQKKFLIEFERHGYKYGVLRPESDNQSNKTWLQIIPAIEVIPLRATFKESIDFTIVLLNTEPEFIHERRKSRGENLSREEEASRAKTAFNKPTREADHVIDASQKPDAVADSIASIVKCVSDRCSNLEEIEWPGLERELNCASDLIALAKKQGIVSCLFGGIAANLYGSQRKITDVDILTHVQNFNWLTDEYGRKNIVVNENNVKLGRVEVCKTPARAGDRSLGQVWDFDEEAIARMQTFSINGHEFPVLAPEDLIVMKLGLGRGADQNKFDLFDARNIFMSYGKLKLDFRYIAKRAKKCNVYDKIMSNSRNLQYC